MYPWQQMQSHRSQRPSLLLLHLPSLLGLYDFSPHYTINGITEIIQAKNSIVLPKATRNPQTMVPVTAFEAQVCYQPYQPTRGGGKP